MGRMSGYLLLFLLSFVLTATLGRVILPILRRKKAGQPILEIGPAWHMSKAGTPTMGGLAFLAALSAIAAGTGGILYWQGQGQGGCAILLIFAFSAGCGAIGFMDDRCKLAKKQNQGLTAAQKYFLQLLLSALFLLGCRFLLNTGTALSLPRDNRVELGFFYYPLALLFLTGMMNACNLTDGVDGLLSGVVAAVSVCLFLYGAKTDGAVFALSGALLAGGATGFLLWNFHPAKMFMGDTGSLYFGGALGAVGIVTGEALLLLLFAAICVWETATVIFQVLYFKATGGKRLFRMAPFHHHLEKCGLSENAIVGIFTLITVICGVAGVIFWN